MIESIITSKTRVKLLIKFFLNGKTTSWLRQLESELTDNSNSLRLELNHLESSGLLFSHKEGNKKIFQANQEHPLFLDLQKIVFKHLGLDIITTYFSENLMGISAIYLAANSAKGNLDRHIELVFMSNSLTAENVAKHCRKIEKEISKKLSFQLIPVSDFTNHQIEYPLDLLLLNLNN